MSALAEVLDRRVQLARLKAGTACAEARSTSAPAAQLAADQALADLDHYVAMRDRLDVDRTGPYRERSPVSFFGDCLRSALRDDPEARRRLALARESRSTSADLGGLVVPATLEAMLADSGHSPRPVCDLLTQELPGDGMTVTLAEVTSGAAAESQDGENTAPTPVTPTSAARSIPVRTVFAESLLSTQVVDRAEGSAFDVLVGREVLGAANALQEARLLAGTGSNGQPTGWLAAGAGTLAVTGTSAGDVLDAIARAAATVDNGRSGPADLVVMHPRRWRWLLANIGDRAAAIGTAATGGPVVGQVLGLDAVASAAVPVALGASTDEDRIIVVRRSDVYAAELPPVVTVERDTTGGALLQARVRVSRYFASGVVSTEGMQVLTGAGTKDPYAT